MLSFINTWWEAVAVIAAIVVGAIVVGGVLTGLIRNVAKSRTTMSLGIGRVGTLKLGTSGQDTSVDISNPTFDYKNWTELLLRFNKVIHASFRKGQIIYKELPEALSVPLEKARSATHRLYESKYLTIFAEECRGLRESNTDSIPRPKSPYSESPFDPDGCNFDELDHRAIVTSRDVRDFRFVLDGAIDGVLNYIRFLYTESELVMDEQHFNRYCEDEVVAIVAKFDSALNDRYYDRSLVSPTRLYRKTRECVPQLGRIIETAIRRGRQLAFDKQGELDAIDEELKLYGVELNDI